MKKLAKIETYEVTCVLGKNIRTTRRYWEYIVKFKHRELKGKLKETLETFENADEVRFDTSHPEIYLYYRKINKHWICAVARILNGDGFLVTAYLTTKHKKKGEIVWQKK